MQANEQFLSIIEKVASKVKPVEAIVEFVAGKIIPTVSANAASCPGNQCGPAYWGGRCGCPSVPHDAACGTDWGYSGYQDKRYYYKQYKTSSGAPCGSCIVTTCRAYSCNCM